MSPDAPPPGPARIAARISSEPTTSPKLATTRPSAPTTNTYGSTGIP